MKLYIFIIVNLLICNLFSQVSVDSLFQQAIDLSKNKNYSAAIQISKQALNIDQNRSDIKVFVANVYAWQANFDSSKLYLNQVYAANPTNTELYDSWLNVLLWNAEYQSLLSTIDLAQKNAYANNYNILLKQLIAYKNLGLYLQGLDLFSKEANKKLLDSTTINTLYNELLLLSKQKTVSAYYSINMFDNNQPSVQHFAFIDYAFKIRRSTLIVRLNYANRYAINDWLTEIDYYHLVTTGYWYCNYGFGIRNTIFPRHRAGLEYYRPLGFQFDASLGGRYMHFTSGEVFIITGHLAKYYKSLWIAARPFYTISSMGKSFSAVVTARKYGKKPLAYWELELGYGNSPHDRFMIDKTGSYLLLNSYSVKFGRNFMIGATDELKCMFGYVNEEFIVSNYRNRYIIELLYKHRL